MRTAPSGGARQSMIHTVQLLKPSSLMKALLFLALLGACFNAGRAQPQRVVLDDRGMAITIPTLVERVVVAGTPLYSEILVDLGALDLLVGVTDSPDNPPQVADVVKIGPSFPSPNIELIIALEPDVVLGAVFDVRDQLEAAGLTVVTPVAFITGIGDLFTAIEAVGLVVGKEAEAAALVSAISRQIVLVESAVVQEEPVRAAFLFPSADGPPFAAGKGSIEGELLTRAGGSNVFSDVAGGNVVSLEELIVRDPQVIFTAPSQVALIGGNPLLSGISAVRNARIFGVKASSLTSTRIADTLQAMAKALYPQAFPDQAK